MKKGSLRERERGTPVIGSGKQSLSSFGERCHLRVAMKKTPRSVSPRTSGAKQLYKHMWKKQGTSKKEKVGKLLLDCLTTKRNPAGATPVKNAAF